MATFSNKRTPDDILRNGQVPPELIDPVKALIARIENLPDVPPKNAEATATLFDRGTKITIHTCDPCQSVVESDGKILPRFALNFNTKSGSGKKGNQQYIKIVVTFDGTATQMVQLISAIPHRKVILELGA